MPRLPPSARHEATADRRATRKNVANRRALNELKRTELEFQTSVWRAEFGGASVVNARFGELVAFGNGVDDCVRVKALAAMLRDNTSAKHLKIDGMLMDPDAADAIFDVVASHATLEKLEVSNCYGYDELATRAARVLRGRNQIRELILNGCHLFDRDVVVIANALKFNTTLRTLSMPRNAFQLEGASALSLAIRRNTTLRTLDISYNHIGDQGATLMALAIQKGSSLTTLDMCCCSIGFYGARAIARALERDSTLTKLDLSINAFLKLDSYGDYEETSGATELARAIVANTTLKELILGDIRFRDNASLGILAAAVERNATLTKMTVSRLPVRGRGFAKDIQRATDSNRRLRVVRLVLRAANASLPFELLRRVSRF